jgi:RNA polymerase sigma factor (sigma-70 family)
LIYRPRDGAMTGPVKAKAHDEYMSLVNTERPRLVRLAFRLLGDMADAEDVVQMTLLAVWEHVRSGQVSNAAAYLRKSVEWNALKRRARRNRDISLSVIEETAEPAAEDSREDEIDFATLEAALDGLPQAQQTVLRMKYYLGLTFHQIADALSISANTAASRCRYGLLAMRKQMMSDDDK